MSGPSSHPPAEPLSDLLAQWLPRQRWYAGKGFRSRLTLVGRLRLPGAAGVGLETHLLCARYEDGRGEVYQVPLTYRTEPEPALSAALIGVIDDGPRGRRWVYDGPHDPVWADAWLGVITGEQRLEGDDGAGGAGGSAHGRRQPGTAVPQRLASPRVLSGEQSNTSIVFDTAPTAGDGSTGVIVKVFRVLHAGDNPDIVVASALAQTGERHVPAPLGWVEGAWTAPDGAAVRGHLGVASEFLPGTRDAWRVACDAVEGDVDFSSAARELGRTTAAVHATLARVLPTAPITAGVWEDLADALHRRLQWAVQAVPVLARHAPRAAQVLDGVRGLPVGGSLQTVHGDYHLGQVLQAPGRGWVLLDFEGEPLRPLAERTRPDLPARDVAGMLRSFDYAARHATLTLAEDDAATIAAEAWAASSRAAFLAGYREVVGAVAAPPALLRALELNKALYEVVYEARNRPSWLRIPLHAVERLLDSSPGGPVPKEPSVPTATNQPPTISRDLQAARRPVDATWLAAVAAGAHHDPHGLLGPHPYDGAVTLRVQRPFARRVTALLPDGRRVPLEHEHEGVWVAVLPLAQVTDYRIEVTYDDDTGQDGLTVVADDSYRFLPTVGEMDLHLFAEGRHEQLWHVLGAHVRRYPGVMGDVEGTAFAVWAPHARAVRVVGDHNHWDGRGHALRSLGGAGVWELFVPGIGAGTRYKFEILGADGHWRQKCDPMARGTEVPPATASVVVEDNHRWQDGEWLASRTGRDPHQGPMSVYEVHLGSWRMGLSYRQLAVELVEYVRDMGFTHVELLPVAEHPFGGSWGYQVTSYYAPTSRFGHPDDFRHLVDALHQAGIGVIMDWVPAHFPKDAWALARFDGQALYEHPDPRRGEHPDWGTLVFDYGRREVRNFLVANALYWLEEFHIDGLRVDAVASMLYLDYSRKEGEWLPNVHGGREHLEAIGFLQETNATAYKRYPGVVTVAEESTAWAGVTRATHVGGLGFGFKWNMGWMNDSLSYMHEDPVHRQYHHHRMTFSMMYAYSENFVLPVSHDEVVHGKGSLLRKMPGDRWQQLANLRAFLAYMWAHPGKQLLFMGCELGQEAEWAEQRSLDWWLLDQPGHRGVQRLVQDLNATYRAVPSLWEKDSEPSGFEWIDANDNVHNTFSFLRWDSQGRPLACIVNFAGLPHEDYRVGLPLAGSWRELLNTDADIYGGSGVGNWGAVEAEEISWHGRPASVALRVPPLGALWLTPADS